MLGRISWGIMALDWVGECGSSIVGWVGLFIVGSGMRWLLVGLEWGRVEYKGKTTSGAKQPVCVCVCVGGGRQQLPLPSNPRLELSDFASYIGLPSASFFFAGGGGGEGQQLPLPSYPRLELL